MSVTSISEGIVQQGGQAQSCQRQLLIYHANICFVIGFVYRAAFRQPDLFSQFQRFIGPIFRRAAGLPVVRGNLLLKVSNVVLFGAPGVLKQSNVPYIMKIARTAATLGRAKLHNMNIVSAARLGNGVKRLVKVADNMDDEFERLQPVFP